MTSTPRILATLLAATAVALTAACADSTVGGAGGGGTTHQPDPGTLPPGQIVYQIGSDGGGFTPSDYRAATEPELTIYADGDVYESNPPGLTDAPAKPWTFHTGHVAPARLARLLAEADRSGLFDKAAFGMPGITDVGGTFARLRPSRAPARAIDVYALFYSEGDGNLSDAQRSNRLALRHLIARFGRAVDYRNRAPWRPDRVAVIQRPASGATDPVGSADPTTAQPWPGPAPARLLTQKSSDGACGVVRGAEAASLFQAAHTHGSTHWTFHGADVYLLVRAVLPGEHACSN
jgi:hypothetical protein